MGSFATGKIALMGFIPVQTTSPQRRRVGWYGRDAAAPIDSLSSIRSAYRFPPTLIRQTFVGKTPAPDVPATR